MFLSSSGIRISVCYRVFQNVRVCKTIVGMSIEPTMWRLQSLEAFAATEFNEMFLGRQRRQDVKFSDVSTVNSVPIFRVCRWFGGTKLMTRLSALENFIKVSCSSEHIDGSVTSHERGKLETSLKQFDETESAK